MPNTTRDKQKYKVLHIPTNTATYHSSFANACGRAKAIDGAVLCRSAVGEQYEWRREYRYGSVKM